MEHPRIKFEVVADTQRPNAAPLSPLDAADAEQLALLLARAEAAGLTPVLNDGLAAGNCAMLASSSGAGASAARLLVSRSGKRAGERASFVEVAAFSRAEWSTTVRRFDDSENANANANSRPSSDTPLLAALLVGVDGQPPLAKGARFLLHGHALAGDGDNSRSGGGSDDGDVEAGVVLARRLGAPVSDKPTMFSTPEDLFEVEKLLTEHPYEGSEQHGLYVRRGHGFFLLADDLGQLEARLARVLVALAEGAARDISEAAARVYENFGTAARE